MTISISTRDPDAQKALRNAGWVFHRSEGTMQTFVWRSSMWPADPFSPVMTDPSQYIFREMSDGSMVYQIGWGRLAIDTARSQWMVPGTGHA